MSSSSTDSSWVTIHTSCLTRLSSSSCRTSTTKIHYIFSWPGLSDTGLQGWRTTGTVVRVVVPWISWYERHVTWTYHGFFFHKNYLPSLSPFLSGQIILLNFTKKPQEKF
jgi:hypothetical protein